MSKLIPTQFLILFLILSSTSYGQFKNVFNVPSKNAVYALETNDSIVFAGTGGSGIYRSNDFGNTWVGINNGIQPWYYYSLLSINDSLFAGSFGYVHVSFDNGDSWTDMNIGLQLNDCIFTLEKKDQYLFAGTRNKGVYSCLLSSGSWSASNNGLHLNPIVNDLLALGTDIYAATDSGLYKSIDNAATWVLKDSGLSSQLEVNKIFQYNSILLAGTSNGLFKSLDWGENWISSGSGLPLGSNVRSFTEMNDTIFLGTYSSLFSSSDLGNSWSPFNLGLPGVSPVYSLTTSSNYLFAGTGGVIYLHESTPLSIDQLNNNSHNKITIYPNPTSHQLSIVSTQIDINEIQIIDKTGKIIKTIKQNTNIIDVANLSNGIYFIKLITVEKTIIKKFVKQ